MDQIDLEICVLYKHLHHTNIRRGIESTFAQRKRSLTHLRAFTPRSNANYIVAVAAS